MRDKKGQVNSNLVSGMIFLVIIGFLGIISITVYDSVEGSMSNTLSSSTQEAAQTLNNFTETTYDGYDLVSNLPIILAASLLLAVIIGLTAYVRG